MVRDDLHYAHHGDDLYLVVPHGLHARGQCGDTAAVHG